MYPSRLWSLLSVGLAATALGSCEYSPFVDHQPADSGTPPDAGAADGGWDGGVDGGPSAEATCQLLDARRCGYLTRCGLLGDTPTELTACTASLAQRWCGPGTWPAHVESGSLRFDPTIARACADAFLSRACADYASLPPECGQFLLPTAGLHQACFDGFAECTEGVCRGAACPRTCQPPGAPTEVCSVDDDCRTGLFCRLSTTTPGVGQCTAYAQVAEPCDDFTLCLDGLWCVAGTCHTVPTQGHSCVLGRCDDLSYCDLSYDGGLCEARKGTSAPCVSGQCLGGFVCSAATATCLPLQLTAINAPCTTEQLCPKGTTCLGATAQSPGLCATPLKAGAKCSGPADCSPELTCAGADGGGTCGPRLADGLPCTGTPGCHADAVCFAGHCTPLPGLGEPCGLLGACRDGTCVAGALLDGGALCTALLGPGADCTNDAPCASGRCWQGSCLTACTP